jgi:hypothetical protein
VVVVSALSATPAVEQPDDNREWLAELLPKSAHKHVPAILEYFAPQPVGNVEVVGARVAVERIEAYGLLIQLDALGRAVRVAFPDGAEVTEWAS